MIKKVIISFIVGICLFINVQGVSAKNSEDIGLTANYAYMMDLEQETAMYQKNEQEKMYPASMTKIVTVITALEMIDNLDDTVTITEKDLETIFETDASAAYFQVGEVVTYKDLIYGALLPSGADATRALAFNLCGDLETFVDKMNELPEKLGLKNTHFVNTTGIHDDHHYTTAYDLTKILQYAIKNETFLEAFSTYAYTTSNGIHQWVNTGMYYPRIAGHDISNVIGCKSGYTEEASNCLASLVKVNGRRAIVIVGKSDHSINGATMMDTNALIQYGKDNYEVIEIFKKGAKLKTVEILYSSSGRQYTYETDESIALYLHKNYDKDDVKYTYTMDTLIPNIKKGDEIGSFTITYQGKELYKKVFKSTKDIKKDYWAYFQYMVKDNFLLYLLGIVFIVIYIALYMFDPKTRTFKKEIPFIHKK